MTTQEKEPVEWILYLKNEKMPAYIVLSKVFIVFGIVLLSSLLMTKERYGMLTALLVLSLSYLLFRKKIKSLPWKRGRSSLEFLIFIAALFLIYQPLMGILFFVAAILFSRAIRQFRFAIRESGVVKDFFPKKEYQWKDIDSLVLNSGVLTINFRDLRIIQGYLANNELIDQALFNKVIKKWGEKEK